MAELYYKGGIFNLSREMLKMIKGKDNLDIKGAADKEQCGWRQQEKSVTREKTRLHSQEKKGRKSEIKSPFTLGHLHALEK